MLCEGALRAVNSHAIKTPSCCFAQGGPCLAGHLGHFLLYDLKDNFLPNNKENNFVDKCRLAPVIQGRRTGPAQKREPPAR